MAVEVEIIQPGGAQPEPEHLESNDSVRTGNPLAIYAAVGLGLLVSAAFLLSLVGGEEPPAVQEQSTTTLAPRGQTDQTATTDGDSANQPFGAQGAERQVRRTTITEWPGGQSLIVIENSQFIYELDLATGRRTSWAPPEILVEADPVVVEDEIVVVGESGAWIGLPFDTSWRFLREANRVMPSSIEGRFWLQTDIAVSDAGAANFEWTEVDAAGSTYRTMLRDGPVELATPEVLNVPGGGVLQLTGSDDNWRVLSENGGVLASGVNDVIVIPCDFDNNCDPVWFDPSSLKPKTGLFSDLAQSFDARFGALLSPDARFVAFRASENRTDLRIASVATGRQINNSCIWGEPLVWSSGSELVACATSTSAELIRTEDGESLGRVVTDSDKWARMAFMPTARLAQSR